MHFISIAVLIYQIIIFSIIVGSGGSGKIACIFTTIIACLWTLTHVFFPPLMCLQFVTIFFAFIIGIQRNNTGKSSNQKNSAKVSAPESNEQKEDAVLLQRRKEVAEIYLQNKKWLSKRTKLILFKITSIVVFVSIVVKIVIIYKYDIEYFFSSFLPYIKQVSYGYHKLYNEINVIK